MRKLILVSLAVVGSVTLVAGGVFWAWRPASHAPVEAVGDQDRAHAEHDPGHDLAVHRHADPEHAGHEHAELASDQLELSPQARANLHIEVRNLEPRTSYKTIELPGMVVDRPGVTDRGVVAPIGGVVAKVHRLPGDTVRPGDVLCTVQLLSESLQVAERELLKASREQQIIGEMKKKIEVAAESGGVAQVRITELANELKRMAVAEQAYRLELQTRGLTPDQIEGVTRGQFVTQMDIVVPEQWSGAAAPTQPARPGPAGSAPTASVAAPPTAPGDAMFEVQELKVELGQQVQMGQTLCILSQHQSLFIEGHAFRHEVPLLQAAIEAKLPLTVEFMEDTPDRWSPAHQEFFIHHIANTMSPNKGTFAFYLPLRNPFRSYEQDGRTMLLWRFRPGQRVRILARVEQLDNVLVVPAEAVVREGPEAYVFLEEGPAFHRQSVRVVHQDRQQAVLANDGSVPAGALVVQGAATQLNRALKAAHSGPAEHHHDH
ncbi:MAG: efflux RND transporter periplasmic adaptor subunit [Pirellulales bacterium]